MSIKSEREDPWTTPDNTNTPEMTSQGKIQIITNPINFKSNLDLIRMYDDDSSKGRFGWTEVMTHDIPFIFRSDGHYCCFRMLDRKILYKYLLRCQDDLLSCTNVQYYPVTKAEVGLLNEINSNHCNFQFGKERFTNEDVLMKLNDAVQMCQFLHCCYYKIEDTKAFDISLRCGFIKINQISLVPYSVINKQRYMPVFYFEGETDNLKPYTIKIEGWEFAYLKFCCKAQGIRNDLIDGTSCDVVSIEHIKTFLPPDTVFDEYWPKRINTKEAKTKNDLSKRVLLSSMFEMSIELTTKEKSKSKHLEIQPKLINNNDSANKNHQAVPNGPPSLKYFRSNTYQMYQLQKIFINGKLFYCINMKPNDATDKWIPVVDLTKEFFLGIPVKICEQVLDVLGVRIYKANTVQMKILKCTGRYKTDDVLSMVLVDNVIQYLPQLTYMINNIINKSLESRLKNQNK